MKIMINRLILLQKTNMIVLTTEIMSIVLKYIIILIINLIILKNCINDDNGEGDISKKAKKR